MKFCFIYLAFLEIFDIVVLMGFIQIVFCWKASNLSNNVCLLILLDLFSLIMHKQRNFGPGGFVTWSGFIHLHLYYRSGEPSGWSTSEYCSDWACYVIVTPCYVMPKSSCAPFTKARNRMTLMGPSRDRDYALMRSISLALNWADTNVSVTWS